MATSDNSGPFDDSDRTIIRPNPGGRLPSGSTSPEAQPLASPVLQQAPPIYAPGDPSPRPGEFKPAVALDLPKADFHNQPLLAEAMTLLSLASRLRQTAVYPAVDELRQRLSAEVTGFENRLLQAGISPEQTRTASYSLCAFLDETILNTPWGAQSTWGQQSLLINFHREAWGGEKFFDLVAKQMQQPSQNLGLMELAYLFLSLGFEGKYRIMANGGNALEKIRLELYQLIQRVKGDYERDLSPRWQGLRDVRNVLVRYIPLWVVGAVLGLALLLAYLSFVFALNSHSDLVFKNLSGLANQTLGMASAAPVPVSHPERQARFKQLLAQEISANMVEVADERLLHIRNAFLSGSDQLKPEYIPMLKKIADELSQTKASILVTGHTDDKPIASARFPSNWHLSNARAKTVGDKLAVLAVLSGKIRVEGRADGEPLVANDSNEHRAINRRVDLLVQ